MKHAVASYPAEVRAGAKGKQTITGKAAVYDSRSEDLGGFREVIMPGAFTKTLKDGSVKKAYWNHNSDRVLGSTKSGTLRLQESHVGLHFEIRPPAWAAEHIESVERGDVDQMSFGFRTIKDSWERDAGEIIRKLHEVQLFEVSPVAMPAYPQTDAQARSIPGEMLADIAAKATGETAKQWRAEIRALISERNKEDEMDEDEEDPVENDEDPIEDDEEIKDEDEINIDDEAESEDETEDEADNDDEDPSDDDESPNHSQPDQAPLRDEPDQGTTDEPDDEDDPDASDDEEEDPDEFASIDTRIGDLRLFIGVSK